MKHTPHGEKLTERLSLASLESSVRPLVTRADNASLPLQIDV